MNSWKKVIPDYEFVLWDKKRMDIEKIPWVKEAYNAKMYAFAADYIRLYALYNYGGIYLDCDVEVIKRFDNLLSLPYFIGEESYEGRMECAAFGAEKRITWIGDCLKYYDGRHFKKDDSSYDKKVLPLIVADITAGNYKVNRISNLADYDKDESVLNLFPNDWFCAHVHINHNDIKATYVVSESTYCVHHFANSWIKVNRLKWYIKRCLLKMCRFSSFFSKK